MNTIITSGRTSSQVTTGRTRFTKEEPRVTDASVRSLESTVVISDAARKAAQVPEPALTPPVAPAAEPKAAPEGMKELVFKLNKEARLFVRNGDGLHRAAPAEVKHRLDRGLPVEIVTRLGRESQESSTDSSYSTFDDHLLNRADQSYAEDSSRSCQQYVHYATSPVDNWDDMEWVDDGERGVPGTAHLPPSGGCVQMSRTWEHTWQSSSEEHWGFFRAHDRYSDASGHTSEVSETD